VIIDIMAQKKLRTPSGAGGLVRYDEEAKSLVELKPTHVMGIIAGLILLELILMFIPV